MLVFAENHCADRVALEIQREAKGALGEFQHLALHHVRKAVDAADAVGDGHHRALGANVRAQREVLDPGADHLADVGRLELLHVFSLVAYFVSATAMAMSLPRTEPSMTSSPTCMRTPPISVASTLTSGLTLRLKRCV